MKRGASMEHPVIYLTGAPASGKSTLARNLNAAYPESRVFAYSEELRKKISLRSKESLGETDIRRLSALVVTVEDVRELDSELVSEVTEGRMSAPFIIDSHPVTKEDFGFRVTGFDTETLQQLRPSRIVCLYLSAAQTVERIRADPMGRPLISETQAQMHTQLQMSVAVQYGILLGKPTYLIDAGVSQNRLVEIVAEKTELKR